MAKLADQVAERAATRPPVPEYNPDGSRWSLHAHLQQQGKLPATAYDPSCVSPSTVAPSSPVLQLNTTPLQPPPTRPPRGLVRKTTSVWQERVDQMEREASERRERLSRERSSDVSRFSRSGSCGLERCASGGLGYVEQGASPQVRDARAWLQQQMEIIDGPVEGGDGGGGRRGRERPARLLARLVCLDGDVAFPGGSVRGLGGRQRLRGGVFRAIKATRPRGGSAADAHARPHPGAQAGSVRRLHGEEPELANSPAAQAALSEVIDQAGRAGIPLAATANARQVLHVSKGYTPALPPRPRPDQQHVSTGDVWSQPPLWHESADSWPPQHAARIRGGLVRISSATADAVAAAEAEAAARSAEQAALLAAQRQLRGRMAAERDEPPPPPPPPPRARCSSSFQPPRPWLRAWRAPEPRLHHSRPRAPPAAAAGRGDHGGEGGHHGRRMAPRPWRRRARRSPTPSASAAPRPTPAAARVAAQRSRGGRVRPHGRRRRRRQATSRARHRFGRLPVRVPVHDAADWVDNPGDAELTLEHVVAGVRASEQQLTSAIATAHGNRDVAAQARVGRMLSVLQSVDGQLQRMIVASDDARRASYAIGGVARAAWLRWRQRACARRHLRRARDRGAPRRSKASCLCLRPGMRRAFWRRRRRPHPSRLSDEVALTMRRPRWARAGMRPTSRVRRATAGATRDGARRAAGASRADQLPCIESTVGKRPQILSTVQPPRAWPRGARGGGGGAAGP